MDVIIHSVISCKDQDHYRDSFCVVIPLLKLINYVKQEAFLIAYKGSSHVK